MADTGNTAQRLIDVDGCRLAIRVIGTGTPPVVCLSCSGGDHGEWADFVDLLSPTTACITYGRPALGGSDKLPAAEAESPCTGGWAAEQLRTLLQRAAVQPPYVLATSSIGAWIGDQYAANWPNEVAGMVLIDPTNLSQFPGLDERQPVVDEEDGGIRFSWELSQDEMRRRTPVDVPRLVVLSSARGRWLRNQPMSWHQPLTLDEVEHHWQGMQRDWVERLNAQHVIADTAGHLVHKEEPALAAHVIRAVVDAARDDQPVRFDQSALEAAGARLCHDHQ